MAIAIRSNSNIIIWARLELNILRFLPLITSREYSPIENSIKYFLIQRFASIIYISCVLLCILKFNYILEIIIILRIIIKLGAAPFHGWFLSLSKSLRLFIFIIVSTIQKIIPIIITRRLNIFRGLIIFIRLIRFLVVLYNRIIILRLIKVLALSRINNLVWFLVSIITGIQFFFIYYWLFLGVYIIFLYPIKNISNQILRARHYNKLIKIFTLLSLGGLPPFLGFLGKLYILKVSINIISRRFLFLLVIRSLIVLFIYMSFSFIILSFPITVRFNNSEIIRKILKITYITSISVWPLLFL